MDSPKDEEGGDIGKSEDKELGEGRPLLLGSERQHTLQSRVSVQTPPLAVWP